MKGIDPPPLGSLQDVILRGYLSKEVGKKIKEKSLLALIAHGTSLHIKEWGTHVDKVFQNYLRAELGLEDEEKEKEVSLIQQYELIKDLRPEMQKDKSGKIVVKGIK